MYWILTRLEDFYNRLNLRRVKRRVAALFLAEMTPTSAHFEAPMAMLPALCHFLHPYRPIFNPVIGNGQ